MNQTNFLAELLSRLLTNNPSFFKKIQLISVIVGAVSAMVMYLKSSALFPVPEWLNVLDNTTVLVSSVIAAVMAQLPNDSK